MGSLLKKIAAFWRGLSGRERAAATLAVAFAALPFVLAVVNYGSRPPDVSNTDVAFEEQEGGRKKPVVTPSDWPRFGLDRARTKFMNAPKVNPPYLRRWSYDRGELIEFAPIIVDGVLYGIDNDAIVFALDADTGKELWKRDVGSLNASSPAYNDGKLYAVNLSPPQVLAMRASDGKTIWQKPLASRAESSPLYVNGRIYFGTENGQFYALRARDGKTIWVTELAGSVKAAPAFLGGSLYVGDYAGEMYAIRAADGRIRWRAGSLGGSFGRSGRFYSTPAVAFGRVYAGNVDGRVYSFDRTTGELAWTYSAGHYVYSGVAAADTKRTPPTVYVGSHDRNFYALDAKTGDTRWVAQPGGQISGPATVVGTVAYVSTFSGNATAGFNIKTGERVFKIGVGQYGPVVSDAVRLYVVGGGEIRAYDPVPHPPKHAEFATGARGVLSPKALRGGRKNKGGEKRKGEAKSSGESAGRKGEKNGKGDSKLPRSQKRSRGSRR